jgi:hypothetical protein
MNLTAFVRDRIEEIQEKYDINFGTISLSLSKSRREAALLPLGRSKFKIELPTRVGRRELLEDLFHELGHAYRLRNGLSSNERAHFFSGRQVGLSQFDLKEWDSIARPEGFVSCYAITRQEEDFCETFSAYLVNGGRCSGVIIYDSNRIDLERDLVLKRKFKSIDRILGQSSAALKVKKTPELTHIKTNQRNQIIAFPKSRPINPRSNIQSVAFKKPKIASEVTAQASAPVSSLDKIRAELRRMEESNRKPAEDKSCDLKYLRATSRLKGI